jgi:lysophospholipase L1-like esterase
MREDMKYNDGLYQLRENQIDLIKEIMVNNKEAIPGGVVFYGDSITELYDIDRFYPEIKTKYNSGVGGFTSETLLWIIDEGVIKYNPKLVVLGVGTNDLGNATMRSPRDISYNIQELIRMISNNLEGVEIIVLSVHPCDEESNGPKAGKVLRSNRIIKALNEEIELICKRFDNVTFKNVFDVLYNKESGNIYDEYTTDGLHLTEKAYIRLTEEIKPLIIEKSLS